MGIQFPRPVNSEKVSSLQIAERPLGNLLNTILPGLTLQFSYDARVAELDGRFRGLGDRAVEAGASQQREPSQAGFYRGPEGCGGHNPPQITKVQKQYNATMQGLITPIRFPLQRSQA